MKLLVSGLVLWCLISPVSAEEAETEWGKGVSVERREVAQTRLGEGNALFLKNEFRGALALYEQALASWDHPAIRFNVVRCLIALDRLLDAHQNLERALVYGKKPFEESVYTEALNYQRLLAAQVAELEISCGQSGVEVKVDGVAKAHCPGKSSHRYVPGLHVLVAQRPGYETLAKDVVLMPGKKQTVDVVLKTVEQATVYETRWKTWQPWAVAGAGLVVAGIGVLIDQQGRSQLDQLERSFAATCSATACTREQYEALRYEETESSAITKNRIGIGTMIAGGTIVAAGVVGVILNRARPVRKERHEPISVSPSISSTSAGIGVRGAF